MQCWNCAPDCPNGTSGDAWLQSESIPAAVANIRFHQDVTTLQGCAEGAIFLTLKSDLIHRHVIAGVINGGRSLQRVDGASSTAFRSAGVPAAMRVEPKRITMPLMPLTRSKLRALKGN